MAALVIPTISYVSPSHKNANVKWPHLRGLPLADPTHAEEGEIDMLIGATTFGHILLYGVKKHGRNYPVLQETELGWIISGSTSLNFDAFLIQTLMLTVDDRPIKGNNPSFSESNGESIRETTGSGKAESDVEASVDENLTRP